MRFWPAALILIALGFAGVRASAEESDEALPIAAVTIYPGQTIADTMLVDRAFPAGTADKYPIIASRDALIGKVARRTLIAGKLIARNSISEPALIERGTIIQAKYETAEMSIVTSVLALQAGALDEAIQVRNVDTGKVIVGVVQADGTVRVGGK